MSRDQINIPPVRPDGLQLFESRRAQELFWHLERVAWVVFLLIIFAAALGVTGAGGPLSRGTLTMQGGEVDYPAIARSSDADGVIVSFAPGAAGQRSVFFSHEFAAVVEISGTQPEAVSSRVDTEGQVWTFDVGAQGGVVQVSIRPQAPGRVDFSIGLDDAEPQAARMIILP